MAIAIDVIFVLFLVLMFFLSFRKGFLTKAWWLLDVALIVLAGIYFAPTLVTILEEMSFMQKLEDAIASGLAQASFLNMDPAEAARTCMNIIAWVVLGILVIIVMAILKLILRKVVKVKVFGFVDKLLGGLYGAIISATFLLVLGARATTLTTFEPVAKAFDVCKETYLFRYIFGENPFGEWALTNFPLGEWIQKFTA